MIKFNIKFSNFYQIEKFNEILLSKDYDIDLVRGRNMVDGKSLMGCFSLDLSKEITVQLHIDDINELNILKNELHNINCQVLNLLEK